MGDAEDDDDNANENGDENDNENDDENDNESDDENDDESDDTVSCFVVRYTKKLAGYFNIGITITKCLLLLRRKLNGRPLSINILSVPPCFPNLEAKALSVHATFIDFRNNKLNTGLLRPDSEEYLNKAFLLPGAVPVYVHAETKLAVFYCCHPQYLPSAGILGVSKQCCSICDAFLK